MMSSQTPFSPAFLAAYPAFIGELSSGDRATGEMWFSVWTRAASVANEAYADQLALAIGTLESRERNIETILEESARRQAEIERLQEVIRRAKQESELIQYQGKSVVAVPYWFMKS